MEPERRSQLLFGKLRALTAEHFYPQPGVQQLGGPRPESLHLERVPYFAGTAAFDRAASRLVVLVEQAQVDRDPLDIDPLGPRPPRGWLGGAIVAAARCAASELHLIGDGSLLTGDDARRAGRCNVPTHCWSVIGRSLQPVVPAPLSDSLALRADQLPPDEQGFVAVIVAAGAVPVVEQGVLRAEVLGLEVARVQRDLETDRPHLAVGVGKHDRLAQSMMNAAVDPAVALAEAVAAVSVHRKPGAASHPANTVARSRWLREMVIANPARFGFAGPCERVGATIASDLKASGVASLTAVRNGHPVVIGCVAGVDLDGPTDLLDTAARIGIAQVILLVPTPDDFAAVRVACDTLSPTPGVVPVGSPFAEAE